MAFADPSTVLTLFVRALGGSNLLAGLPPTLTLVGSLAPQLLVAGALQRRKRVMPSIWLPELLRFGVFLLIGTATFLLGAERPTLVLAVFLLLYLMTRLAGGASALARAQLIRRIIPAQQRSHVVSLRLLSGGVSGLVSGLLVRYILDGRLTGVPANYGLLMVLAGGCFLLSALSISYAREPRSPQKGDDENALDLLRQAPEMLRNQPRYALYVGVRMAAAGAQVAAPFYIVYATERLGAPASMAGIYIAMRTTARLVSSLFWGWRCQNRGSARTVRTAMVIMACTPLLVLLFGVAEGLFWTEGIPHAAFWLFGLVFLGSGLGGSGMIIGRMSYLYEIAPQGRLPIYLGLSNTLVGPLHLCPWCPVR